MLKEEKMAEAIEKLKNGNVEGFNYIYSETFNFVYSRAKYMLGEEELALDLTQEVYLILYNKIGDLNSGDSLYAWLKTVIFHKGLRLIEKRNKTVLLSEETEGAFDTMQDDSADFEENIVNQEDVQIIKNCINSLSDEQRLVILAYYYDNMKTHEIAETLNISEGTVKSRLSLARKHLKNLILEQEKKQGYKLHSFGAVTMAFTLGGMLNSNSVSTSGVMHMLLPALHTQLENGVSTVSGAVEGATSVADNVAQDGAEITKKVLQKTASNGTKKIVVGIVGAVVVTAGIVAAIATATQRDTNLEEVEKKEPSQETVVDVVEAEQENSDVNEERELVYVRTNRTDSNAASEITTYYEYLYNMEELTASVIIYDGSRNKQETHEFLFHENGNRMKSIHYDKDNAVKWTVEYMYDENGRLVGCVGYNSAGVIDYRCELIYDGNGNLIKDISYDGSGAVTHTYTYEYDENGNEKSALYESELLSYQMNFQYDENGNSTSWGTWIILGDTSSELKKHTYDEYRNLLSIYYQREDEVNFRRSEAHDGYGNLMNHTIYKGDDITSISDYQYEEVEMTEDEKVFYENYILSAFEAI